MTRLGQPTGQRGPEGERVLGQCRIQVPAQDGEGPGPLWRGAVVFGRGGDRNRRGDGDHVLGFREPGAKTFGRQQGHAPVISFGVQDGRVDLGQCGVGESVRAVFRDSLFGLQVAVQAQARHAGRPIQSHIQALAASRPETCEAPIIQPPRRPSIGPARGHPRPLGREAAGMAVSR